MQQPPQAPRSFLPAASHDWFLPLYDPLTKLLGGDKARQRLFAQANIQAGHRILDIGCGTGSLVVELKRRYPEANLTGLDPDARALAIARRKADQSGVTVQFDQGFSDQLPYPSGSFDRVLSSFMFHHLPEGEKEKTLREVLRVLKPGGSFHLLDFEGADDPHEGHLARWLHSRRALQRNSAREIVSLLDEAGFVGARKTSRSMLLFFHTAYYTASAPTQ